MAVTAGIKNLSWAAVDGGDAAPSATVTAANVVLGNIFSPWDAVNSILPDEIALRIGLSMTTSSGTVAGAGVPAYTVFALWLTAATAGTPTSPDRDSDLALFVADTTTVVGVNPAAPYTFGPTNPRIFATKGRWLRLMYRINAAANIAGNVKFGADWAGIFGKN